MYKKIALVSLVGTWRLPGSMGRLGSADGKPDSGEVRLLACCQHSPAFSSPGLFPAAANESQIQASTLRSASRPELGARLFVQSHARFKQARCQQRLLVLVVLRQSRTRLTYPTLVRVHTRHRLGDIEATTFGGRNLQLFGEPNN